MQVDSPIRLTLALKALGFERFKQLKVHPLSKFWFQMCINLHPCTTAVDDHGNTPLHYACSACDVPVARLLMRAGADPNAENFASPRAAPGDLVPASCPAAIFDVLEDLA